MKKSVFILLIIPFVVIAQSCSDNTADQPSPANPQNPTTIDNTWLVPVSEVLDGGPGKDGIPSVDEPEFTVAQDVDFLNAQDLVLMVKVGDVVKAYPHPILDWHEIVNDEIGGKKMAITYCPLTGTGIAWNRVLNGSETTFGVSGLLYNTNLMPYDRLTNSTWSQQRLDCVNGQFRGQFAETYSLVETTFETMKKAYPQGLVLNTNTGFSRSYGRYPYGDYRTNDERLVFPISKEDRRLDLKERTLGVLLPGGEKKVYGFTGHSADPFIIEDQLGDTKLVVVGSKSANYLIAYETGDRQLSLLPDAYPAILQDQSGIKYDLLGHPVDNAMQPLLSLPRQFIGYWFSWGAFYPDIPLYSN